MLHLCFLCYNAHPNNTITEFSTDLYHPLKFEYPYEVALVEIIFPEIIDESEITIVGKIEIIQYEAAFKSHKRFLNILNKKLQTAARHIQCNPPPQIEKKELNSSENYYHFNEFESQH